MSEGAGLHQMFGTAVLQHGNSAAHPRHDPSGTAEKRPGVVWGFNVYMAVTWSVWELVELDLFCLIKLIEIVFVSFFARVTCRLPFVFPYSL